MAKLRTITVCIPYLEKRQVKIDIKFEARKGFFFCHVPKAHGMGDALLQDTNHEKLEEKVNELIKSESLASQTKTKVILYKINKGQEMGWETGFKVSVRACVANETLTVSGEVKKYTYDDFWRYDERDGGEYRLPILLHAPLSDFTGGRYGEKLDCIPFTKSNLELFQRISDGLEAVGKMLSQISSSPEEMVKAALTFDMARLPVRPLSPVVKPLLFKKK